MKEHRTETRRRRRIDLSRIEKLHPHKTFLFFALLGSTLVFMTITFLYLVNFARGSADGHVRLPRAFMLSTLVLLFSSFTLTRVKRAFQEDSFSAYFSYLGLTMALGLVFAACQAVGWNELFSAGYLFNSQNHYSFFYVISGIHFLHVFAGLVFLGVLLVHGYGQSRDPVKSLLFFSNDYYLTRIDLAAVFWHFIDFLWLGLFLIFLFTF